jgi:hypothetical protein
MSTDFDHCPVPVSSRSVTGSYDCIWQIGRWTYKYGDEQFFSTLRCEHTEMNTIKTRNRDVAMKERITGRENDT